MTNKEFNDIVTKYRFDDYIKANSHKLATARGRMSYLEDIQQAGWLGLHKALQGYDAKFGGNTEQANSFISYVTTTIHGHQLMMIDYYTNIVRIPKRKIYVEERDPIFFEVKDIDNFDDVYLIQLIGDKPEDEYLDGDYQLIYQQAINNVYDEVTKSKTNGKYKVEAHKIMIQHNKGRLTTTTLQQKLAHLPITLTTVQIAYKKINKAIKKEFYKLKDLYDKRIDKQIREIYS